MAENRSFLELPVLFAAENDGDKPIWGKQLVEIKTILSLSGGTDEDWCTVYCTSINHRIALNYKVVLKYWKEHERISIVSFFDKGLEARFTDVKEQPVPR